MIDLNKYKGQWIKYDYSPVALMIDGVLSSIESGHKQGDKDGDVFILLRNFEFINDRVVKLYFDEYLQRRTKYIKKYYAGGEGNRLVFKNVKVAKANIKIIRRNVMRNIFE